MKVVRIPNQTAARVLAVAEARAAAIEDGAVVLQSQHGERAYLTRDDDGWHVEPATLFDPPAWTTKVLALIQRHGA